MQRTKKGSAFLRVSSSLLRDAWTAEVMKACDSLICPSASIKPLKSYQNLPTAYALQAFYLIYSYHRRLSHRDGTSDCAFIFHATKIKWNLELSADAWRFLLGVQMKQGPGDTIVLCETHDELQRPGIDEILLRKRVTFRAMACVSKYTNDMERCLYNCVLQ